MDNLKLKIIKSPKLPVPKNRLSNSSNKTNSMSIGVKKTKALTKVNKIKLKGQKTATETRTNLNKKSTETHKIIINTKTTSTDNAPNNYIDTVIKEFKLKYEEIKQRRHRPRQFYNNDEIVLSVLADAFSEKLQRTRTIRKTDSSEATKEQSKKNSVLGNDKNNESLPNSQFEALKDQTDMNLLFDKSYTFVPKSEVKNITNSVTSKSSSQYDTAKVNLPSNKVKFVSAISVKIPGSKVFNGQSGHRGHLAAGVHNMDTSMVSSKQNNTNKKFLSKIPTRNNVSKDNNIRNSSLKVLDLSLNTGNTFNRHAVQCQRLNNCTCSYSSVKHLNAEPHAKNCIKRTIKITTHY
ncbi:uncharacterized protein LOC126903781 [Daktulosphaira vitifoliae]|uniref:uncharacterized protein LOC126903781 n=1 Tax=Daktulosphaira vitifoliae TaxID=58002 RepID=UPI0021AA4D2E|nr:uncharacterized protein LOC126903781 [Daktulosphaira vitifoliae]